MNLVLSATDVNEGGFMATGYLKAVVTVSSLIGLIFMGLGPALAAEVIRINGSGAALEMIKPMIKEYRKKVPGVTIEMEKPLGSSGAIKAVLAGVLDIAVSSKMLKPDEISQGASSREYGKVPLAIVSAAGVGKSNITTRELEDIYAGRVKKWPSGETIRIVLRPKEDIDTKILRGLSPGMDKALLEAHQKQGMLFAVTDPESNNAIVNTPGAIGAAVNCCINSASEMNFFTLNGQKPSVKGLVDGSYPLAKDIRFVTPRKASTAAVNFLQFVYSRQGRSIATKSGVLVTVKDDMK